MPHARQVRFQCSIALPTAAWRSLGLPRRSEAQHLALTAGPTPPRSTPDTKRESSRAFDDDVLIQPALGPRDASQDGRHGDLQSASANDVGARPKTAHSPAVKVYPAAEPAPRSTAEQTGRRAGHTGGSLQRLGGCAGISAGPMGAENPMSAESPVGTAIDLPQEPAKDHSPECALLYIDVALIVAGVKSLE
jgi:hypothetical protein